MKYSVILSILENNLDLYSLDELEELMLYFENLI